MNAETAMTVCGVPMTNAVRDALLVACLAVERSIRRRMTDPEMDMLIVAFMRAVANPTLH